MPSRSRRGESRRLEVQQQTINEDEGIVDLKSIAKSLSPYMAGVVETLGMAAQPKLEKDGVTKTPGDVKAAVEALDLFAKYMAGTTSDRGSTMMAEVRRMREAAIAEAQQQPKD